MVTPIPLLRTIFVNKKLPLSYAIKEFGAQMVKSAKAHSYIEIFKKNGIYYIKLTKLGLQQLRDFEI